MKKMKARHMTRDKISSNSRIVIVGTVLEFNSVDQIKEHYNLLKKYGFEDEDMEKDNAILFPDEKFSSDSFVSIYKREVCIGTPNNYCSVYESDWSKRLDIAAKCQAIYEDCLHNGKTPLANEVLDQALDK